jgi:hypothetical protein
MPPLSLTLPVTTTPAQVPKIVAAGLALSKYVRNDAYSSTEPRRRSLWIEFDEPPLDPHDSYFIRLLATAPDPLLSDNRFETYIAPEEAPLGIDPELVRVITPGQSDDDAGLSAMVPLLPGASPRHFIVPVPPGLTPDGAEMFGMFTYELRVGHISIWSTAQGRFGRPLRSTGVQHPAPTLLCTANRDSDAVVVESTYAQAVLNGKNITAHPPRTQIWALLYAQVRQADDEDNRNILLDDRILVPRERAFDFTKFGSAGLPLGAFENQDAPTRGITAWRGSEVTAMLASLGLPSDSSLSVLCVEMMPTMAALIENDFRTANRTVSSSLFASVFAERAGTPAASTVGTVAVDAEVRPLSDGLGHYRILRTSPLVAITDICCTDC